MTSGSGFWSSLWLASRSLFWTIVLPGSVAGFVPWRFFGLGQTSISGLTITRALGLAASLAGAALLIACIVEFARSGRGTLSPMDPPRVLVVAGLYRYVRNPMYLAVTTIVAGEVLWSGSRGLAEYLAVWFLGANLFVLGYEEPALRNRFGQSYDEYTRHVGRWIPRLTAHRT